MRACLRAVGSSVPVISRLRHALHLHSWLTGTQLPPVWHQVQGPVQGTPQGQRGFSCALCCLAESF